MTRFIKPVGGHAVREPGDHKGRPYRANVGGRRLCAPPPAL